MKLLTSILLTITLFAQTGRVYLPTAEETSQARAAYQKVKDAEVVLKSAQDQWAAFKKQVKKSHGIAGKDQDIDFNAEFTTFELESSGLWFSNGSYGVYGLTTCANSGCISGH